MKHTSLHTHQGFTLLEIMAVVVLVAMVATGATVMFSTGGPKKDLESAVEQFSEYAHQLADLSIMTGEPVGLFLVPPKWSVTSDNLEPGWRYRWRRFIELPSADGQVNFNWVDIEDLEEVEIDEKISLFVQIEGQEWEWEKQDVPKTEIPIFIQYPSGEAEPFLFQIEFAHEDHDIEPLHVELDMTGRLQYREAWDYQKALEERG